MSSTEIHKNPSGHKINELPLPLGIFAMKEEE
jgi:hypothetical protein